MRSPSVNSSTSRTQTHKRQICLIYFIATILCNFSSFCCSFVCFRFHIPRQYSVVYFNMLSIRCALAFNKNLFVLLVIIVSQKKSIGLGGQLLMGFLKKFPKDMQMHSEMLLLQSKVKYKNVYFFGESSETHCEISIQKNTPLDVENTKNTR